MKPDNLFLIGYRCTGKSSVRKLLGARLGRSFIDTDCLQQACTLERRVVATGGGLVLDGDNMNLMKGTGRIIWLRASPQTISARMVQDRESEAFRPALTSTDSISEIEETLAKQAPLNKQAMDYLVDTDHRGVDEICDLIIGNI